MLEFYFCTCQTEKKYFIYLLNYTFVITVVSFFLVYFYFYAKYSNPQEFKNLDAYEQERSWRNILERDFLLIHLLQLTDFHTTQTVYLFIIII